MPEGEARLLRIFVGESDSWHGEPLYQAIVGQARKAGLTGATVVRGMEGFGASSHLHKAHVLRHSDAPVIIEIVDEDPKIQSFLPLLDEMVGKGLITLERAGVSLYRTRPQP